MSVLGEQDHTYGEWYGDNAGGQEKFKTFSNNPQIYLQVKGE